MTDYKVYANDVFVPINTSKKRYVVLKGGANSGKSTDTAQNYIIKMSDKRQKGRNIVCIRKAECTHRQSTYAELTAAISRIGLDNYFKCTTNPLRIKSLITGNEIVFRGINSEAELEKIKSITFQSGKLTDIWIEEASELQERDLYILNDRLRGDLPDNLFFQMRLTFNPVNVNHWLKKTFFDIPREDVFLHHSTYLNNRFAGKDFAEQAEIRKQLDYEGYKIYYLGEWGELSGLILTNWNWIDSALEQKINDGGNDRYFDDIFYGQDFGYTHNNAIVKLGFKDGDLYALDELVVNNKDSNEIIKDANEKNLNKNIIMYCDNAEPDRIKMWQTAGYYAIACDKSNRIKSQIDWLKQRRIYVHPNCVTLGKELSQWRWDKDRITGDYKEEPIKINDDCIAAMRYGTEYYRELYPLNYKQEKR